MTASTAVPTFKDTGTFSDAADMITQAIDGVKARYPSKFSNGAAQRRTTASMVDMGGANGGSNGSTTGRTWNDLLPHLRRDAEYRIAQKQFTKEDYLANCEPGDFRSH